MSIHYFECISSLVFFYECNTIQVLCFNMVTFKCPTINRILLTIAQMIPLLNDRDWLVLDTG